MTTQLTGGSTSNLDALSVAGATTLSGTTTFGTAPMSTPSGSAPVYGARAWCYFNGGTAGTNAPLAGGNVTSVTRNATGNYTINFTTAMPDTNYSAVIIGVVGTGNAFTQYETSTTARTVNGVTFFTGNSSTGSAGDCAFASVVIFR